MRSGMMDVEGGVLWRERKSGGSCLVGANSY